MITIQNGKLLIPDSDRFIGFAGDNAVITKQFTLIDQQSEGCTYTLCLRFDDGIVRTVPLTAALSGSNTVLTWEVHREDLHASGVVQAQIKIAGSDGNTGHTAKDFFLIGSAVELDDSGDDAELVTLSRLREALSRMASTAPYVDDSGYWCIYDPELGEYVRSAYHVSGIAPDSAMSDSSMNSVANRIIKQYADAKAADCNTFSAAYTDLKIADKVPVTRKIAQIALSSDISAADLMAALRPNLYRTGITPLNSGITGQLGIGINGEVYFCTATDRWVRLVSISELNEKMDLITEVDAEDVEDMDNGSIFFVDDVLTVKFDDETVSLVQSDEVYTKAQIDTMIGNVETLLAAI